MLPRMGGPVIPLPPRTHHVTNKSEFLRAIGEACCGDEIQLAEDAVIDLTGEKEIELPGNVIIDGGRAPGVAGGLILTNDRTNLGNRRPWIFMKTTGPDLVFENLRFRGPDGSVGDSDDMQAYGLRIDHPDAIIRNCELYNWPSGPVVVNAQGVTITDNYIHDNKRRERGYGVVVWSNGDPIIEYNVFEYNRHCVANGRASYTARHNVILPGYLSTMASVFDMHGENEHLRDNSSRYAGTFIHIHNNDIHYPGQIVGIRGRPRDIAIVENNCVYPHADYDWIIQEFVTFHDSKVADYCGYNEGLGKWVCWEKKFYPNLENIVVRNNRLQTASGCADR